MPARPASVGLRPDGWCPSVKKSGRTPRHTTHPRTTTRPQIPRHPLRALRRTRCHRPVTTEPLFQATAYDVWDDQHCGCETCLTPWGTQTPTEHQSGGEQPKVMDRDGSCISPITNGVISSVAPGKPGDRSASS